MSHDHHTDSPEAPNAGSEATRLEDLDRLITAYEQLEESISRKEHNAWQIGAAVTLVWLALAVLAVLFAVSWIVMPWSVTVGVSGVSLMATIGAFAWIYQAQRRRRVLRGFIDHEKGLRSQFMTAAHEYRAFMPLSCPTTGRVFDLRLARL